MNKEQLIADITAMSVLELFELVKALEEEFGVSAAASAVGAGTGVLTLPASITIGSRNTVNHWNGSISSVATCNTAVAGDCL